MKVGDILIETSGVSTAAEDIDWIYNKTKDSGSKLHYMLKRIIGNWFTEIHSKMGTGATSHKAMNDLSILISYAELYIKAKNKNDQETMDFSKPVYEKTIKKIKNKFKKKRINEITAGEILEKQKGFAYILKKKGDKYYIYHIGGRKKAYPKGVKELISLPEIVKPWLEKTSITYKEWNKKLQIRLVRKYINKLEETL